MDLKELRGEAVRVLAAIDAADTERQQLITNEHALRQQIRQEYDRLMAETPTTIRFREFL